MFPTDHDLLATDRALRAEADVLLTTLRPILEPHAPAHAVGSYALELMVWRDLDIQMDAPAISVDTFFDIGRQITTALVPWKCRFSNHRDHAGDPGGLYWGIKLGDIRKGAWKIDLWAFDHEQSQSRLRETNQLKSRLTSETRLTILRLKSQLWRDPRYRDQITSQHIYDAVLDHDALCLADFWNYIERKPTA
jgi:hypothetical protein